MRFSYLVLVLLLLQAPILAARPNAPPTGPVVYPVILAAGYYEYFPVQAFVNETVVHYATASNASVTTALMSAAQFQDFNGNNGPVSNSVSSQNGTDVSQTAHLVDGSYDVLVYAYGGSANATLSLSVYPNNPLAYGPIAAPEPTGIASYGLTNDSGSDSPYAVASTGIVGLVSISSMMALNSTAGSVGANPSAMTVQLNAMLVVDEGGNRSQVYWCQNTPDFVTAASQVALSDNVWNSSVTGFLSNDSVTSQGGGGYVSIYQQNGTPQYYYAFGEPNSTYTLPMGMALLMNATSEPGTGVLVRFGAGMTGGAQGTDWFDNVTIHDPGVTRAYFETNGNYSTPIGTFYDAELVFAGEGNGEATTFTSLASSMGLYYTNGTSSALNVFPSYFGFGRDTAEAAYNLRASYLGNGQASVTTGTPAYDYLGAASGSYSLSSAEAALGFPGFGNNASTATSSTSTTPAGSTTQGASSTSNTGLTSPPKGITAFPYQLAAVVAFVALIVLAYAVFRLRPGPV